MIIKKKGDIDFFYYDERLHIVYEEEYVVSHMILGAFYFYLIKSYFYLYIRENPIIINNRLKYDDCCL